MIMLWAHITYNMVQCFEYRNSPTNHKYSAYYANSPCMQSLSYPYQTSSTKQHLSPVSYVELFRHPCDSAVHLISARLFWGVEGCQFAFIAFNCPQQIVTLRVCPLPLDLSDMGDPSGCYTTIKIALRVMGDRTRLYHFMMKSQQTTFLSL